MKKVALALVLAVLLVPFLQARGRRPSSPSSSAGSPSSPARSYSIGSSRGPVSVRGYTTKTGKYVRPHTRSLPGAKSGRNSSPAILPRPSAGGRGSMATPLARSGRPAPNYCATCKRDADGRIDRSEAAKRLFQRQNPCPVTGRTSGPCPGYQIHHKIPLSKGGADAPANMRWLSEQQHKAVHATR